MITSHFLPAAFRMFDLYLGTANAPKLDVWGIDEYHIPCAYRFSFVLTALMML